MITIVSGSPGAGKTLAVVYELYKQCLINNKPSLVWDEYIQQFDTDADGFPDFDSPVVDNVLPLKRLIFSDIKGLKLGEISDSVTKVGADWDWRTAPDGSIIALDEIHKKWPSTGKSGMSDNTQINNLDEHRHKGLDFFLISQFPTKIHFEVRTNSSVHWHLMNIAGSPSATKFIWPRVVTNPDDYMTRTEADKQPFIYPRKVYKYYRSTSLNTKKVKIPLKMYVLAGIFAVPSVFLLSRLSSGDDSPPDVQTAAAPLPAAPPVGQVLPAGARQVIYSGCIANDYSCTCYDSDYYPVEMEFSDCKNMLESPLPTKPVIVSDS